MGSNPAGGTISLYSFGVAMAVPNNIDSSVQPDEKIGEDEKILAVLAYIPIICLIPLLQKQRSDFVARHARLGFALFLVEILALLLRFRIIWDIVLFLCVCFALYGIYKVLQGKTHDIPFLSDLFEKRW
ncbi:hypothetical protein KKG05_09505 [bacterium]|nr:hypothetical protein [bacterium]MBU1937621.1 hypothetical protein [bacterium]